jgi:CHAD domain-containing protein
MKPSYVFAPDDRADESVRSILCQLFKAIRSNIGGVLADSDVESLHDFRVANRRTRTALSQIKGVLDPSAVIRFSDEFKWLGKVTGPCRDLDVTLLQQDVYRQQLGNREPELDAFHRFLRERRTAEHDLLVAAFRTPRFSRLIEDWDDYLSSESREEEKPPLASSPIIAVAGPRILKAFKRLRKRSAAVNSKASAELFHRLRIDGKKLRYLLEFFSHLYPSETVTRCIRELKRIQDILGEFNDTQVQLALVREFEHESVSAAAPPGGMGRLTHAINERQDGLRIEGIDRFSSFTSGDNRRLYRMTFRPA